jgi:hypothetical protein
MRLTRFMRRSLDTDKHQKPDAQENDFQRFVHDARSHSLIQPNEKEISHGRVS